MQPVFGASREQLNELYIHDYTNLSVRYFHFHSIIEILFVREGTVDVCIGENNKTISSGEVAVATSFEPHSFYSDSAVRATILFIPSYLCEDFSLAMKNKKLFDPFFSGADAANIISSLDAISLGGLERIEERGHVYLILGSVLKRAKPIEKVERTDADLGSKLLFYINENFREDVSLEEIAARLGYSTNYISKSFRATFNIGIKQYITTVRLKNAVMLLRESDYGVTECALDSGFPSVRNFYRAFSAEFGCTPREYLRREGILK